MVEVKVDLMGNAPFLWVEPDVYFAIRRFFGQSTMERLIYLHGEVDNEERAGYVRNITIPPQISEYSTVELNTDHDDYFEWHNAYKAKCEKMPVIGMAHSFSGGAHHSSRDENTDALFGEEGFDRGDRWFFSVTAHSGKKDNDFRVDAVYTPAEGEETMFDAKQLAIVDVGWGYDLDEDFITEMIGEADNLVGTKSYVKPPKKEAKPKTTGADKKK